eukprot:TRINITY_DN1597_c0_g1_i1.p1 TRINITY_DN1597_c0_g1~~TRINITY_DN1597_c0_g1_i1.p1  ORF type:complete len:831 (-),score=183.81 TRINITY_DN1597_c0_g1_i1:74-2566(-)
MLFTRFALATTVLLAAFLLELHALNVTYDSRAILLDGQRKLLIAGCIHYPRSTPAMWPSLISKAKAGGIDVIQTYLFWNIHEPVKGQYDFTGRKDIFAFFEEVQKQGLYVNFRIGPYACAEWNLGGFPEWLREIPGIQFRTDNDAFKQEMAAIVKYIVNEVHKRNLFADQGGPVILTQIENEYGNVEGLFGDGGKKYAQWAAQLALGIDQVKVPWIMCQQWDAPDPIIETCNGFYCDSYTPKSGTPKMWTENWPGWFQAWGSPFPQRPSEDVAFAVARFFARGGAYACYYMYHGGTNFERTAANNLVTSYDYDVHLDEYGLEHEPKYSHLAALHALLHQYEDLIMSVDPPSAVNVDFFVEAHVYKSSSKCITFLSNINNDQKNVSYQGLYYIIPGWSVSLYDGCDSTMKFLYNTATISSPTFLPIMKEVQTLMGQESDEVLVIHKSSQSVQIEGWIQEPRYSVGDPRPSIRQQGALEMLNFTHDATDWAWYSTNVTGPISNAKLCIATLHDTVAVFANGAFFGFDHSSNPCFVISAQESAVEIRLLVSALGLPNYGAYFEVTSKGITGSVTLNGNSLDSNTWVHQAGLFGESNGYFSPFGSATAKWNADVQSAISSSATWIKASFSTPAGDAPLALDLSTMGKGFVWVNGHGLGRYWNITATGSCAACYNGGSYSPNRCAAGCGQPSQRYYHVPRDWLVSTGKNLLVMFDDIGGNPFGVKVVQREIGQVCGYTAENYPAETNAVVVECTGATVITHVDFASFGNPFGRCGSFEKGTCHAANSTEIVQRSCVGQARCEVPVSINLFGDPCPKTAKILAVQAKCDKPAVSVA